MTSHSVTLAAIHTVVLRKLDDGFSEEDSAGIEIGHLNGEEHRAVDYLVDIGLAKLSIGWNWTIWFRLTPLGRAVLQALRH